MPATATAESVETAILRKLPSLGVEASVMVTRDTSFEELDVDSLDLAELSQMLEDEFGVYAISDDDEIATIGDAIDLVLSRAE